MPRRVIFLVTLAASTPVHLACGLPVVAAKCAKGLRKVRVLRHSAYSGVTDPQISAHCPLVEDSRYSRITKTGFLNIFEGFCPSCPLCGPWARMASAIIFQPPENARPPPLSFLKSFLLLLGPASCTCGRATLSYPKFSTWIQKLLFLLLW